MMLLKPTSKHCCCFPSNNAFMFVSCTKSRYVEVSSPVHTHLVFLSAAALSSVEDYCRWSDVLVMFSKSHLIISPNSSFSND